MSNDSELGAPTDDTSVAPQAPPVRVIRGIYEVHFQQETPSLEYILVLSVPTKPMIER